MFKGIQTAFLCAFGLDMSAKGRSASLYQTCRVSVLWSISVGLDFIILLSRVNKWMDVISVETIGACTVRSSDFSGGVERRGCDLIEGSDTHASKSGM